MEKTKTKYCPLCDEVLVIEILEDDKEYWVCPNGHIYEPVSA